MSRIAAKYTTPRRSSCSHSSYRAGEVTDRAVGDASKVTWNKNEGLEKGLGIKIPFPKLEKDEKAFKIYITHAAHDVHGLSEHQEEAEDFRTSKLVKRSVRLQFDDVATAHRAFNACLEIDTDALKTLLESETLQDLLAQNLDLRAVSPKAMKPMKPWQVALHVPS